MFFQYFLLYIYIHLFSHVVDDHDLTDFSVFEHISDSLPDVLLEGDENAKVESVNNEKSKLDAEQRPGNSYHSLEEKRKLAFSALQGDVHITIRRDHIVTDLLLTYRDKDIVNKHVLVTIQGEDAHGNGVAREMYSLFWDTLLSKNAEGDGEFTVPVVLSLTTDDYVSLGKILTHQFVQFGIFPVRINQASIQQAIFGHASDECLVSSFLRLLPLRERKCLSNALFGEGPFPVVDVLEVLEDYNIRDMPSRNNIQTIVLQVAHNELVTKPYMCLLNIRKGMASFWDNVSEEEIQSMYDSCQPTARRIISSLKCSPSDTKEAQVLRWLTRYLKASTDVILSNFMRFCSGTDVIVPGTTISLKFNVMPPAALRPMARTCFRVLKLPKNYESFTQMRSNLDTYIGDPSSWDLKDNID